jgi:catechol 2,3-dioxygenase-like lactoylglutathione lyase family enzyme
MPSAQKGARVFKGVSEVFLPVRDLDRALAWYAETFGWRQTFRIDERGHAGLATPNGSHVNLVESPDFHPVQFPTNQAIVNFGFNVVSDAEDVETARAHLMAAGADVGPVQPLPEEGHACFDFRDPEGNPMSVVWHGGE